MLLATDLPGCFRQSFNQYHGLFTLHGLPEVTPPPALPKQAPDTRHNGIAHQQHPDKPARYQCYLGQDGTPDGATS